MQLIFDPEIEKENQNFCNKTVLTLEFMPLNKVAVIEAENNKAS